MSATRLDTNTALVVIDLQKGIVALPTAHPVEPVIAHARELLDAFRSRGLPVVLVNVAGGAPGRTEQPPRTAQLPADWTELVPELNRQPGDHLVTKDLGRLHRHRPRRAPEGGRRHADRADRRRDEHRRRIDCTAGT